jgi:hypothetical protein
MGRALRRVECRARSRERKDRRALEEEAVVGAAGDGRELAPVDEGPDARGGAVAEELRDLGGVDPVHADLERAV